MMIEITDNEAALIRGLIRTEVRRKQRGQAQAAEKWGRDYDPTTHNAKLDFLRQTYAKFVDGTAGARFLEESQ